MAKVKTFRIHSERGVPDREIREFLDACEEEELINVHTTFIPSTGEGIDSRLTVIVTKLDDHAG